MARKRMISPEFWMDEKIGELAFVDRLIFIGLWSFAEDTGVGRANPKLLKVNILPYDDTFRVSDFEKSLEKLSTLKLILLYKIDEQKYYYIYNFKKHQTINKPTPATLPLPTPEQLREQCGSGTVVLPPKLREENIREDKLKEEKENARARGEFQNIFLSEENYQALIERFSKSQTDKAIEELSAYMQSKGKSYKDYYATLLNWIKRDLESKKSKDKDNQGGYAQLW